ncbi:hypothetical protein [Embleya sp. NPDC020630]|uniref:hypothetical protein n=1 Tax=Embleya sp. NPDC020630 TaxID=3363979 RepID=UPI0037B0C540
MHQHITKLTAITAAVARHGAVVVGGAGGTLIGYAVVGDLHAPELLRIALAGLAGICAAIVLDGAAMRTMAALRRRDTPTAPVVGKTPVGPPVDVAAAAARMAHLVEIDGRYAAEREAAFFARLHLDGGGVWPGDVSVWQGHRDAGASMHLAPGVRLIWTNDTENPETFTLATGSAATELLVENAEQLRVLLEQLAHGAHHDDSGDTDRGGAISYWEQLV